MFLIDDVKDSDATNTHGKDTKEVVATSDKVTCSKCGKKISVGMHKAFNGLCSDCYKASK